MKTSYESKLVLNSKKLIYNYFYKSNIDQHDMCVVEHYFCINRAEQLALGVCSSYKLFKSLQVRQAAFHIKLAKNALFFSKHLQANARRGRLGDTIIKHFARARRCNLLFPRAPHTERVQWLLFRWRKTSLSHRDPRPPLAASTCLGAAFAATNQRTHMRRTWFELYDVEMNFTTGKHAYYARSGRRFFADVAAGSFFRARRVHHREIHFFTTAKSHSESCDFVRFASLLADS
jgi:hypothetical protein